MESAIHRFVRLLRLSGLRISVSEVNDAMAVAAQPGILGDRELLKSALAVALVKDWRDLETFGRIFDRYFALVRVVPAAGHGHGHSHDDLADEGTANNLTLSEEPMPSPDQGHDHGRPMDIKEYFRPEDMVQQYNLHQEAEKIDLAAMTDQIVLSTDQASPLDQAARVELSTSRLHGGGRPSDLSTSEQQPMAIELTAAQEMALLTWLTEFEELTDQAEDETVKALRRRLSGILEGLPEQLKAYLEALLALDQVQIEAPEELGVVAPDPVAEARRNELEDTLRRLVRSLNGAPRARRRASAAGKVDGSRTMRTSMRFDGVPFRPITVSRVRDRPKLVVLADVSLSVRATAAFTLHLVHGLQSMVSRIRSWAFVADLAETSDLFAEYRPEEAMRRVTAGDLLDVDADSDYGRALGTFVQQFGSAVSSSTTVIVLGDARGNGHDPNLRAFEEISRRARETIWLTPEPSYSWRLGRCDLPLYAEYCDRVRVVRDLAGLERASSSIAGEQR